MTLFNFADLSVVKEKTPTLAMVRVIHTYAFTKPGAVNGERMIGFVGMTKQRAFVQFFLDEAEVSADKQLEQLVSEIKQKSSSHFSLHPIVLVGSTHPAVTQSKKFKVRENRLSSPVIFYAKLMPVVASLGNKPSPENVWYTKQFKKVQTKRALMPLLQKLTSGSDTLIF